MDKIKTDKLAIIATIYSNDYINSVIISKCVDNWFSFYKENIIVLIDNNSPNKEYFNLLNEKYSNLYIISNNSSKFKYEYGGYKIGFKFVDAPYYIFMQGTNLFTRKKNLEECIISPFIYVREVDEYKESPEIIIAQDMYKSSWNSIYSVLGSNFYCNKEIAKIFYENILTKIPITNKIESCASERITAEFINNCCNIIYVCEKFIYKNKIYTGNIKNNRTKICENFNEYLTQNNIDINDKNKYEINNICDLFIKDISDSSFINFFIKISMNNQ